MISPVLILNVSRDSAERTWRRPAEMRVAAAVVMAVFPVLPAWWLGEMLVASHVRHGDWIAAELGLAAWAGQRFTVGVAGLGSTYWSGLRSDPDAVAEAVSDAAGLPPPPPRREIISRDHGRKRAQQAAAGKWTGNVV
jgi:hypothetical protein